MRRGSARAGARDAGMKAADVAAKSRERVVGARKRASSRPATGTALHA